MATNLSEALNACVSELELGLRRWRRATAFMGIALGAVSGIVAVLIFQLWKGSGFRNGFGELVARRFVAIDDRGKELAVFGDLVKGKVAGMVLLPTKSVPEAEHQSVSEGMAKTLSDEHASGIVSADQNTWILLDRRSVANQIFGAALSSGPDESSLLLLGKPDAEGNASDLSLVTSGSQGSPGAGIFARSRDSRYVSLMASNPKGAVDQSVAVMRR